MTIYRSGIKTTELCMTVTLHLGQTTFPMIHPLQATNRKVASALRGVVW